MALESTTHTYAGERFGQLIERAHSESKTLLVRLWDGGFRYDSNTLSSVCRPVNLNSAQRNDRVSQLATNPAMWAGHLTTARYID